MFGPFKKKTGSEASTSSQGVDFTKVKTGGPDIGGDGNIVSDSVLKSGNISSIGLNKEDQAALVAKRNEIPLYTKILKYASITVFALMAGGFLFLTADLDKNNTYFSLTGLTDNTGAAYTRLSQENTQKTQELKEITQETDQLTGRIQDQVFGNHLEATAEIKDLQRIWYTTKKEVTRYDEEAGEDVTAEETVVGYLDMIDYLIEYFQDRSFKTTFFKEKEEGLTTASGARGRTRIGSSEALLMSNEVAIRNISINEETANINLDASDIYGKIFTLAGEIVDITNSTPIFKDGHLRNFQKSRLDSGDSGMNLSLRLNLQDVEDEDPADENYKYLLEWLKAEGIL